MDTRSRSSALAAATLALGALAVTACASDGQPDPATGPEAASAEQTAVIVENESEWSLRVYARVGGAEYYLGSMQGFSQKAFEVPTQAAESTSDFRLTAKATGPLDDYHSNQVMVEAGDTIRWTVMRSFAQTRATIRVS